MSNAHDYNEAHVAPVAIEDIPRHTWEVRTSTQEPRLITGHMLLRPSEDTPVWRLVDFVDVEDGWRIEQTIDVFRPDEMVSITYIATDGQRREVSL